MKKEEKYTLTPKGLLLSVYYGATGMAIEDKQADAVMDDIELYFRRNDYNAIVFDGKRFEFAKVEGVK